MVVQDAEGFTRANGIPIEVGKHLLAAFESHIEKKHDGDTFVGKVGIVTQRHLDGCAAMLAVINDKLGGHRNMEESDAFAFFAGAERFKSHLSINRGGNGGEDVAVAIIENVAGELWQPVFVQNPLGAEFGDEFFFVKQENLGQQA